MASPPEEQHQSSGEETRPEVGTIDAGSVIVGMPIKGKKRSAPKAKGVKPKRKKSKQVASASTSISSSSSSSSQPNKLNRKAKALKTKAEKVQSDANNEPLSLSTNNANKDIDSHQEAVPFRELNPEWSQMQFLNRFEPRYQRNNKKGGLKNLRCFPQHSLVHKPRGFCGTSVRIALIPSSPTTTDESSSATTSIHATAATEHPSRTSKLPVTIASAAQQQQQTNTSAAVTDTQQQQRANVSTAEQQDNPSATTNNKSDVPTQQDTDANITNFQNIGVSTHQRRLFCWAAFTPLNASPLASVGDVLDMDSIMDREFAIEHPTRSWIRGEEVLGKRKGNKVTDSLYDSMQELSPSATVVEFNHRLKGWHYSWPANKHNCDTLHCFQVMTFELVSANEKTLKLSDGNVACKGATLVRCCAVGSSPSFVLFCRRRHRFSHTDSSAAAAAVTAIAIKNNQRGSAPPTLIDTDMQAGHIGPYGSLQSKEAITQGSIAKLVSSLMQSHSSLPLSTFCGAHVGQTSAFNGPHSGRGGFGTLGASLLQQQQRHLVSQGADCRGLASLIDIPVPQSITHSDNNNNIVNNNMNNNIITSSLSTSSPFSSSSSFSSSSPSWSHASTAVTPTRTINVLSSESTLNYNNYNNSYINNNTDIFPPTSTALANPSTHFRSDDTSRLDAQRRLLAESMSIQASNQAMIQEKFTQLQQHLNMQNYLAIATSSNSTSPRSLIGQSVGVPIQHARRSSIASNVQDNSIAQYLLGMAQGKP